MYGMAYLDKIRFRTDDRQPGGQKVGMRGAATAAEKRVAQFKRYVAKLTNDRTGKPSQALAPNELKNVRGMVADKLKTPDSFEKLSSKELLALLLSTSQPAKKSNKKTDGRALDINWAPRAEARA